MGFCGLVGWHYYCEPLLEWPRLKQLIRRIKTEQPDCAGFILWTNGTLLHTLTPDELRLWSQIVVTDYRRQDWTWLRAYAPKVDIRIQPVLFDGRASGKIIPNQSPCLRSFNELIIDHYGNGHLCCWDFRGEIALGSVWDENGFRGVAGNYLQARNAAACLPGAAAMPGFCRVCGGKHPQIGSLYAPVASSAEKYIEGKRQC